MSNPARSTLPALLVTVGLATAQSPWTQADGGGFFQLSAYAIRYDELFRSSGPDFRTSREIIDGTIEGYGELGLTDDLTLIGRVPFRLQDAGDPVANPTLPLTTRSGSLTAFGNVAVGVRNRWLDDSWVLSGQFDVEFPTGRSESATGLRTGYDAFTFEPAVSVGRGFGDLYAFGYAGFGFRTDDYSNYWRAGGEVGFTALKPLTIAMVLDAVQSFEDGDVRLPRSNRETGLFVNDQEWVAIGFKGLLDITDGFGVQATVHTAVSGNNVPRSLLVGFGCYVTW